MQGKTRIILMATIAAGIGALMIGSSLATAAFASLGQGAGTSQRINQANIGCNEAFCGNFAQNSAHGGGSTSQSISQVNAFCTKAVCINSASNTVK
jgi:hypothetical protein